ncbi:MAG: DUF460 domain-containing protein [Euryarchaeota archaeon]|nr:DUF460 domain-containing protein [Euryarchaeota archaeon]
MVKNLIVGVDPGTTVGIAILNLEGSIVDISSYKNFSVNDIVEYLLRFGMPVILATDVSDMHQTVEKVASSFECRTFTPQSSLSIKEKNELTREYSLHNDHERDALASALKAYAHYKTKFENIDARLEKYGAENLSKAVKTLVLRDYTVKDALNTLKKEEKTEEKETPKKKMPKKTKLPKETVIQRLKEYNRELTEKMEYLKEKSIKLERKNKRIRNETDRKARESKIVREKEQVIEGFKKEIAKKKEEISGLQEIIRNLKGIRRMELSEEGYTIKILEGFTRNEIKALNKRFKIKKGDIIYIKDSSGGGGSTAELIVKKRIRALIVENIERMSHSATRVFENEGIPILNIKIKIVENFGVVDKKEFENAYAEWKLKAELRAADEKKQWLDELLEEYKKERIKKME